MNPKVNAIMYPDSKNKNSFADGMEFQDFVVEQFNAWGFYIQLHSSKKYQYERGESVQRTEIKLDNRCTETGRLSVEVSERTRNEDGLPWTPSGIYRKDNTVFYIQGNSEILFLFSKKYLQWWKAKNNPKVEESFGTVQKFYISLADAERIALATIRPKHGKAGEAA